MTFAMKLQETAKLVKILEKKSYNNSPRLKDGGCLHIARSLVGITGSA